MRGKGPISAFHPLATFLFDCIARETRQRQSIWMAQIWAIWAVNSRVGGARSYVGSRSSVRSLSTPKRLRQHGKRSKRHGRELLLHPWQGWRSGSSSNPKKSHTAHTDSGIVKSVWWASIHLFPKLYDTSVHFAFSCFFLIWDPGAIHSVDIDRICIIWVRISKQVVKHVRHIQYMTVPSSSCSGIVARRDRLQRKWLLTNLWLRLAADGASNFVFDDVSFEKFSSSLDKCRFRKSRIAWVSYFSGMTWLIIWACCFSSFR